MHCNNLQHTLFVASPVVVALLMVQHAVTLCNTLHHTAAHVITQHHIITYCNTMQHTPTHRMFSSCVLLSARFRSVCTYHMSENATRCNTLQHTATRCNALQRAATRCNTLKDTATVFCAIIWVRMRHTAIHCNTLQRTALA